MKWITAILSLYLVFLSSLPCSDIEETSPIHERTEFASDNHSHEKQNDLCSPFCICNCCGTHVLSYQSANIFEFKVPSAVISILLPSYKSVFISNFYGSIWQPPQIV